jgi:hypothetical protein
MISVVECREHAAECREMSERAPSLRVRESCRCRAPMRHRQVACPPAGVNLVGLLTVRLLVISTVDISLAFGMVGFLQKAITASGPSACTLVCSPTATALRASDESRCTRRRPLTSAS